MLHSSAWRDQPAITLLLLEAGADPNLRDSHSGETALHAAVRGNNRAAVELLRAHGADLSIALTAQSEQCASGLVHPAGSTALDIASRSGYAEIVRVLGR